MGVEVGAILQYPLAPLSTGSLSHLTHRYVVQGFAAAAQKWLMPKNLWWIVDVQNCCLIEISEKEQGNLER